MRPSDARSPHPAVGTIVDDDLTEAQSDPDEIAANEQASAGLFPGRLKIRSTSVPEIVQAATRHGVHSSVVIGQVQRLTDNWSLHRAHIPKVRPALHDEGLMS